MGFPRYHYNRIHLAPSAHVRDIEETVNKDGEFVTKLVDQSEVKLPPTEMFDLKNILDAGVDIDEVNSKVMSTRTVNADNVVRKYTKKSAAPKATDDKADL